jgi:hypothetical protein
MPEKKTIERARQDEREGKAPTTQAGEFVREEIHHVREGKHGARSPEQAIAIGLSKARRAGIKLPPPAAGEVLEEVREKAERDIRKGRAGRKAKPAARRSRATPAHSSAKGEQRHHERVWRGKRARPRARAELPPVIARA